MIFLLKLPENVTVRNEEYSAIFFFLSNQNGKCLKSWSGYSDINIKVNCLIGEFFLLYILQKLKILPDQNILFLWNELTELEKNKNSFFLWMWYISSI